MNQREKAELVAAVRELIRTDLDVQRAIVDVVCSCPNIPVRY